MAATWKVLFFNVTLSLIWVSECKSAMNKKESLFASLAKATAGFIAPNIFPKWGLPVLCIPVRILAISIINSKL